MVNVTYEDAVKALEECVAERGADFVYRDYFGRPFGSACYYTESVDAAYTPGCLIGMACFKLGIPLGVLSDFDESNKDGNSSARKLLMHLEALGHHFAQRVHNLFAAAQNFQDANEPWGDVVERAIEFERRYA